MNLDRCPRAGDPVVPGRLGAPPLRLHAWEPVDSDPSGVLVRPAGSVAFARSGLLAWVNVDGGASWLRVTDLGTLAAWTVQLAAVGQREAWGVAGAIGADCTTFDLGGLQGSARGPFRISLAGKGVLNAANQLSLRLNGSGVGFSRSGLYASPGVSPPANFVDATANLMTVNNVGAGWRVDLTCLAPHASRGGRICVFINGEFPNNFAAGTTYGFYGWFDVSGSDGVALDAVGLASSQPNGIGAGSTYVLRRI